MQPNKNALNFSILSAFLSVFCLTDIFKCPGDTKKFVHKFANVHPPDSGICLFSVTGGLCGQNFGSFMARVMLDAVFWECANR